MNRETDVFSRQATVHWDKCMASKGMKTTVDNLTSQNYQVLKLS